MRIAFMTEGPVFDGGTQYIRGLGGAETALVNMAKEMQAKGNDVTVFCNTPNIAATSIYDDVLYRSPQSLEGADFPEYDVVFAYRYPDFLTNLKGDPVRIFVVHDMPVNVKEVNACGWAFDDVFFVSAFQRRIWEMKIPLLKSFGWTTSNAVARKDTGLPTPSNYIVWGARPERGLIPFLQNIWPSIAARYVDLKLKIIGCADDIPRFKSVLEDAKRVALASHKVEWLGFLSKPDYYEVLQSALMVVYPTDVEETSCMLALDSLALGIPFLTTEIGALGEYLPRKYLVPNTQNSSEYTRTFLEGFKDLMENPQEALRLSLQEESKTWETLADEWLDRVKYVKENKTTEKIHGCMIYNGGESKSHDLKRAVESVLPFVDDLHIAVSEQQVDLDRLFPHSKNIERVPDATFERMNNISWLRNESIADITDGWILWFDADEQLIGGENLKKYRNSKLHKAYRIKQLNLSIVEGHTSEYPLRLFKAETRAQFEGYVHERPSFDEEIGPRSILSDVEFIHYGYLDIYGVDDKVKRNTDLVRRETRSSTRIRPILYYYMLRDCVYFAKHELYISGPTHNYVHYLREACRIWQLHSNTLELEPRRLGFKLYQYALEGLSRAKKTYDGNLPFMFPIALGESKPLNLFFLNMEELKEFINTRLEQIDAFNRRR